MESIKAAAKAIRKSPKVIRKKIVHSGDGHSKLDDDWLHSQDPVESGVTFYVKYLGNTAVTKTHGAGSTDDAVKNIIHHAKSRSGGLQKVQLTISSTKIVIKDVSTDEMVREEPLYKVSYCTVDPYNTSVFCYISRDRQNASLACYGFLCSKRSKAEAITLTVAQAFNIAYEKWQQKKKAKKEEEVSSPVISKSKSTDFINVGISIDKPATSQTDSGVPTIPTIKTSAVDSTPPATAHDDSSPFLNGPKLSSSLLVKPTMTKAKSMDQIQKGKATTDTEDMEFTLLAEARSNPNLMDTGNVKEGNLSDDIMDFLGGDLTTPSQALGSSADDLMRL